MALFELEGEYQKGKPNELFITLLNEYKFIPPTKVSKLQNIIEIYQPFKLPQPQNTMNYNQTSVMVDIN